jgi:hypothetical protein
VRRKYTPERTPLNQYGIELDKIRHQAILSSLTKYRFFFAGLIFAILSYSVQKPIESGNFLLNWSENVSWLFLLISGLLSIKECGGFSSKLTEDAVFSGLSERYRKAMYIFFVIAMLLLVFSRIGAKLCT